MAVGGKRRGEVKSEKARGMESKLRRKKQEEKGVKEIKLKVRKEKI